MLHSTPSLIENLGPTSGAVTTPPLSPTRIATPPNPSQHLPPSPPRSAAVAASASVSCPRPLDPEISSALQNVRQLHRGCAPAKHHFRLDPRQFTALKHAVFGDARLGNWARDKLHWSYNAHTGELALRMAGQLHEKIGIEIGLLLLRKLRELKDNKYTTEKERAIIDGISLGGSPRIKLGKDGGEREPDVSFLNERARHGRPPFVAEVGVAQDGKKDFALIAEQYLLESGGKIRTFLGIDVEYRRAPKRPKTTSQPDEMQPALELPLNTMHPHAESQPGAPQPADSPLCARAYVWQYGTMSVLKGDQYVDAAVTIGRPDDRGIEFQNAYGVVDPTATIDFPLNDFCPRWKSDTNTVYPSIRISHQELANVVSTAEAAARQASDEAPASIGPDFEEMSSPATIEYRHLKRSATSELEEDIETEEGDNEFSSFEGQPKVIELVERRVSLGRRAKKARPADGR